MRPRVVNHEHLKQMIRVNCVAPQTQFAGDGRRYGLIRREAMAERGRAVGSMPLFVTA